MSGGRAESRNAARPAGSGYNERKKLSKSCLSSSESELLNRETTALASEPLLACCWIAFKSPPFAGVARPS